MQNDWESKLSPFRARLLGWLAFRLAARMLPLLVHPTDVGSLGRSLLLPLFGGLAIARSAEKLPAGQAHKLEQIKTETSKYGFHTRMLGFQEVGDREQAVEHFFDLCAARSLAHFPDEIIARYEESRDRLHPDSDAHGAVQEAAFITRKVSEACVNVLKWMPMEAKFLERSFYDDLDLVDSGKAIGAEPIWTGDVPKEWNARWIQIRNSLLARGEGEAWFVWTDWYEARLRGDSVNEVLELPRVSIFLGDEWNSGPRSVNSHIKSYLDPMVAPTVSDSVGRKVTDSAPANREGPTTQDRLGRRPFAHKLVELIEGLKADTGAYDFAIHMHAPWGVGKSSVIAMVTEILEDRDRDDAQDWAVFTFNAWEHEHRKLPWWPFLRSLRQASIAEKQRRGADASADWTWLWWWMRRAGDFAAPILFAAVAIGLLCWGLISQGVFVTEAGIDLPKMAGLIAGVTTLLVTFSALGSRLIIGPKDQSDFYFSLSRNPWKRVRSRFRDLAGKLNRPVCIFIDDLDRCQASYVVDVLTGIQTHFRKDNVVYVVAADRKWLRTSFETAYKDFVDKSGQKEDRLGYLFLEKVFQLSVPLPRIPAYYREAYIRELLDDEEVAAPEAGSVEDSAAFDAEMKALRQGGGETPDAPPDAPEESEANEGVDSPARPSAKEAARKTREALEKSASKEEASAVKHRLRDLIDCFPSNPRVIKRVINAYGVHMFEAFFEDIHVSEKRRDLIARWAILEQCYPALIDILIDEPELAEYFNPIEGELSELPAGSEFKSFFDLPPVKALFVDGETFHLTPDVVREFTEGQRG